jgi:hypothetical protein
LCQAEVWLCEEPAHGSTSDDLVDIAGSIIYTFKKETYHEDVAVQLGYDCLPNASAGEDRLTMGSAVRVYLLRLLEELIVDRLSTASGLLLQYPLRNKSNPSNIHDISNKESPIKQTQTFLTAFTAILTPVWFASLLERCRDECSASAAFRLLIIMIQNSPTFTTLFYQIGGF